jgi:hypothetical protein
MSHRFLKRPIIDPYRAIVIVAMGSSYDKDDDETLWDWIGTWKWQQVFLVALGAILFTVLCFAPMATCGISIKDNPPPTTVVK